MKKRVFSVLLAVMLVVASFSTAFAANSVTATASKNQVEVGEEFTVTFTMTVDTKVSNLDFGGTFDPEYVELVKWYVDAIPGAETTMQSANPDPTDLRDEEETPEVKEAAKTAGKFSTSGLSFTGNKIDASAGVEFTATFKALKKGTANFGIDTERFRAVALKNGTEAIYQEISTEGVGVKVVIVDAPCKEHTWGEWTTVDATCTEAGMKVRTCTVCGAEETEEIAATGHKWEVVETKEATCTEAGHTLEVCSVCGEEQTTEIKAKGHTWGKWVLDEDGVNETRTCEVCNATETREYNPETGDTMMSVLFFAMAAMFVAGIVVVNKARKNA